MIAIGGKAGEHESHVGPKASQHEGHIGPGLVAVPKWLYSSGSTRVWDRGGSSSHMHASSGRLCIWCMCMGCMCVGSICIRVWRLREERASLCDLLLAIRLHPALLPRWRAWHQPLAEAAVRREHAWCLHVWCLVSNPHPPCGAGPRGEPQPSSRARAARVGRRGCARVGW